MKTTSENYDHLWISTTSYSMTFKLRVCQDAKVALANFDVGTNTSYEVLIGLGSDGTTQILVTGVQGESNSTKSPGILDCDSFKVFWISWFQRTIRFGRGSILFQDELLSLTPKNVFEVHRISMTSWYTDPGYWIFSNDLGKNIFGMKCNENLYGINNNLTINVCGTPW